MGRVGQIVQVNPEILQVASAAGFIPVVSTVAADMEGQPLNVNADTAAAAIASAVGATKLILLTDTNGVLADKADPKSTISQLDGADARRMIESGQRIAAWSPN